MDSKNMTVLANIINAVESGDQNYKSKRNYAAYVAPYTNSTKEYTITLGWAQYYGNEAYELVLRTYTKDPEAFHKIDPAGIIQRMIDGEHDWVKEKWNPSLSEKKIIIKIIDSDTGHTVQDEMFAELMTDFISDCEKTYTNDIKAEMMYCEIRHLGGKSAVDRIFKRCNGNYTLDSIMAALKADQSDTSSSNQVGDKKFWSRHEKCREFIDKYAVSEATEKEGGAEVAETYTADAVINVAIGEIGYLEKASNSNLDSKTANAGSNNYTKYWRDMDPSLQGSAWCDCYVDWCFVKAYGRTKANELECGGCGEYYTPTSAQKYKDAGRFDQNGQRGDQIFFKNSTRINHTGLVEKVDDTKVYTIEGNTSGASGVVANGGGVCRKSYLKTNSRIAGYGHPKYTGTAAATATTSGGGCMFTAQTVKSGSQGASVKLLQRLLKADGYKGKDGKTLTIDGDAGANTVYAIKKYQAAKKLTADGIAGSATWKSIIGL